METYEFDFHFQDDTNNVKKKTSVFFIGLLRDPTYSKYVSELRYEELMICWEIGQQ
jgi:hypothetical protein